MARVLKQAASRHQHTHTPTNPPGEEDRKLGGPHCPVSDGQQLRGRGRVWVGHVRVEKQRAWQRGLVGKAGRAACHESTAASTCSSSSTWGVRADKPSAVRCASPVHMRCCCPASPQGTAGGSVRQRCWLLVMMRGPRAQNRLPFKPYTLCFIPRFMPHATPSNCCKQQWRQPWFATWLIPPPPPHLTGRGRHRCRVRLMHLENVGCKQSGETCKLLLLGCPHCHNASTASSATTMAGSAKPAA